MSNQALRLNPETRKTLLAGFTAILQKFEAVEAEGLAKNAAMGYPGGGGPVASPMAMAEGHPCPKCGSGKSMKMGSHQGNDAYTCRGCGHDYDKPAAAPMGKTLAAGSGDLAPSQKVGGPALGKAWRAGGPQPKTGSLSPAAPPSQTPAAPKPPQAPGAPKPIGKAEPQVDLSKKTGQQPSTGIPSPKPVTPLQKPMKKALGEVAPDAPGKVRGSILDAQRKGPKSVTLPGKSPKSVRGVQPEKMATPTSPGLQLSRMGKDELAKGPPPIPHDARATSPTAGAAIPPPVPGSARVSSGRGLPPKLPGMPGRVGLPPTPELAPMPAPARPPRASTLGHVKLPVKKAEGMCKGCGGPHQPGAHPEMMDACLLCGREDCDGRCSAGGI